MSSKLTRLVFYGLVACLEYVSALHGRFLTISDLHPDPFYQINTSVAQSCHRGKPDSEEDRSGYWGTPTSDCDAPPSLIDALFHEVQQKWAGKIDFVVVMGDLARHDLDSNVPRTLDEIIQLNRNISHRLQDTFSNIPIVPSIGNNDVFPHNIMAAGPSKALTSLQNIYSDYVPEEQYHTFARGGYYSVQVIPGKLVVVAINTLFWFDSNKIVDGCPPTKRHSTADPGTEELDWLQAQLKQWRKQGLQVILSGHVPPGDYYPDCYSRFADIVLAYQDTIIGSMFGHKNVDHFILFSHSKHFNDETRSSKAQALIDDLRSSYSDVSAKANADDYMFLYLAPSVVPTYLPAYRIWTYNTTESAEAIYRAAHTSNEDEDHIDDVADSYFALAIQTVSSYIPDLSSLDSFKKRKKKKRRKHEKIKPLPRHVSSHSPARTNRFLSLLGYEQYYLQLEKVNKNNGYGYLNASSDSNRPWPEFELEYATYTVERLKEVLALTTLSVSNTTREEEEDASKRLKKLAPYCMPDLTIKEWLKLSHRLSHDEKLWKGFEDRIFVSTLK